MKYFIAFILCTLFSFGAAAQVAPKGITKIMLGGNYQTGNTSKSGINANLSAAVVDSIKEISFNTKYVYGRNNDVLNQKEFLIGGQFDYRPLSSFSPFVRLEFYNNEFKLIGWRTSALAGGKYTIYRTAESDYSISAAVMYDREKYIDEANLNNKEKCRLSIRPKFKQRLMENVYLSSELYYKPNISQWNDYLVYSVSHLNFIVNKYIFLRCSYEYDFNSRPASEEVKRTDTAFIASLGIEF